LNKTVFDQTKTHWTSPVIDVQIAANARAASIAISGAMNPTFNLTYSANKGFGEPAAYLLALGDIKTHTVPRAWVEYFISKQSSQTL